MKVPQFAAAALAASFAASVIANEQRGQQDAQQGVQQQSPSYSQQAAAGNSQQHDADKVRKVQKQLSEKGHDVSADGIWGPQTEQALKDFQQAQGIEASGELNEQTLSALGIDDAQGATAATGAAGTSAATDTERDTGAGAGTTSR